MDRSKYRDLTGKIKNIILNEIKNKEKPVHTKV